MRVFYATKEGGDLYPLSTPVSSKEELVQELETKRTQVLATVERGLSLHDSLFKPSKLTWCSYIGDLEIFAVLFPDATIWDSVVDGFYTDLQDWCEEILMACQEKYK